MGQVTVLPPWGGGGLDKGGGEGKQVPPKSVGNSRAAAEDMRHFGGTFLRRPFSLFAQNGHVWPKAGRCAKSDWVKARVRGRLETVGSPIPQGSFQRRGSRGEGGSSPPLPLDWIGLDLELSLFGRAIPWSQATQPTRLVTLTCERPLYARRP